MVMEVVQGGEFFTYLQVRGTRSLPGTEFVTLQLHVAAELTAGVLVELVHCCPVTWYRPSSHNELIRRAKGLQATW